jgi:hypothetical protein
VHIHIHKLGVNLHIQNCDWIPPGGHIVCIGIDQRILHLSGADDPAIDRHEHIMPAGAGDFRLYDIAGNVKVLIRFIHGNC